jgi:hypothetical protein
VSHIGAVGWLYFNKIQLLHGKNMKKKYDLTFVILSFHISLIKGSELSLEVTATCYGM